MKINRLVLSMLTFMGVVSCAPVPFELCLYNEQGIDVSIVAKPSRSEHVSEYSIPAKAVFLFRAGWYRHFTVQTQSGPRCYPTPNIYKLNNRWYYSGFSNYKLGYAKLGQDNKIYLFDKSAHGDHKFYKTKVPAQPQGFPIEPIAMNKCA